METKNALTKLYPIFFIIIPYLGILLVLSAVKLRWPGLTALAAAGIIAGAVALALIIKKKMSFKPYQKEFIISIVGAAVLCLACNVILSLLSKTVFEWGWWLSTGGIFLKRSVLFAPAVLTTAFWLIKGNSPSDKTILTISNPILHLTLMWFIFDTLLSCLPT